MRAMAIVFAMAGAKYWRDLNARTFALLTVSCFLFLTLGFTAELHSAHPATYALLAAAGVAGAVQLPTPPPRKKKRPAWERWLDVTPLAAGALLLTAAAFGLFLWSHTHVFCW